MISDTLPVVPHGNKSNILEKTFKSHYLWNKFKHLNLTINERFVDTEYSEWLLNIGNGRTGKIDGLSDDCNEISNKMLASGNTQDSLINYIFGKRISVIKVEKLTSTVILSAKNEDVNEIHDKILELLEGETKTYLSYGEITNATIE